MKENESMPEPIPWWSPQMTGNEYPLIKDVLDSNYLNEGDITTCFEQNVAKLVGARHAIAVTSGTIAIFLSLAALAVGPGDEVIVPDVSFIATANAVRLAGANPVLVDIDPSTLNIEPEEITKALTPRTKAVIPVHVSGRAANMPAVLEIARSHNLFVVEDAAEAFMSSFNGKYLGTFGHLGCLSFSPNKTITSGQGGMILTDDDALHKRLRELKDQGRPARGTGGDDIHYSVGYNFKLTNLQAAVGLGQLSALHVRIQRQKRIYSLYSENLKGFEGIRLQGFHLDKGEVPQWTDAIVDRRDELDRYLRERAIFCRRFWFPIHTQKPYLLPDDNFPNSSRLIPKALWLPSAFTISDQDVATVCSHIKEFFRI
jgi:perosamine synthetase